MPMRMGLPCGRETILLVKQSRFTWDEARYWVNSYMEDGTYLLPGEVAERIEMDGMFQQMDLFTKFSEQVGDVAMKQIEEPSSIMPLGFTLPERTGCHTSYRWRQR